MRVISAVMDKPTERYLADGRMLSYSIDVDDLVQKEQALAEAALARYTELYDFSPLAYFTLDPIGKILQTNLAGAKLLGLERMRLTEGRLGAFLAPIIASGYRGPLSLEVFNDGFRAAPTRLTAIDGLRSLRYLEEVTARTLRVQGASAVADSLFSPPPAADYHGVEFLEFAVDDDSGARLGKLLQRMHPAKVAGLLEAKGEENAKELQCIKTTLLASMQGYAPMTAIEFGRKVLFSTERPTFSELEAHVKKK